jgi:hypothetical protein
MAQTSYAHAVNQIAGPDRQDATGGHPSDRDRQFGREHRFRRRFRSSTSWNPHTFQ